jgi:hypothetical protein
VSGVAPGTFFHMATGVKTMSDPIAAPVSVPFNSVRNVLAFVKGGEKLSQKTILSGLTLVAYGSQFIPLPDDATPAQTVAPEGDAVVALEQLLASEGEEAAQAFPWLLIVTFVVQNVLPYLIK